MFRNKLLILILLTALGAAIGVQAAPPATLGYQGRLADSGGNPITANLSITFRLFEVPSGGSPLWSEVQPAVSIDGGNLAVELGSVNPLPRSIWGRQLYLGIQVSGDTEMLPRPPLTASPFAFRAASTMKQTVLVSAEGTPAENGTALLAAVAAISGASASNPVVVQLDAGTFDLGTSSLVMPAYTTLAGQSQQATLVTSAHAAADSGAAVRLSANSGARDLTVRNTATAPTSNDSVVGIGAYDPAIFQGTLDNVSLERVTGESIAAPGVLGQRAGIALCVSNSRVLDVTGRAEGGLFAMGMRADCPTSEGVIIDGANLFASNATDGLRGSYLTGGGPWQNIKVFIETNPTLINVYGIRVFPNSVDVGAALMDLAISINGSNAGTPTNTLFIEGLRIEHQADVEVRNFFANFEDVRAMDVRGIHAIANDTNPRQQGLRNVQIGIEAVQNAQSGPGSVVGINARGAAPILENASISVRCMAGGYNLCAGVRVEGPGGIGGSVQPGPMRLEHVRINVAHADPADTSAQTQALQLLGPTQVQNSNLRVVRSADAEPAAVLNLTAATATLQVQNSSLVMEDSANPNTGCLLSGVAGATAEWYSGHLQGQRCDGAQVNLTCAGNSRRGFGFLASTCP